jgi:anti-sigma28 factor (negative regulator of flagellin synthesis)
MVNGINNGINQAAAVQQNKTQQKQEQNVNKTEAVNRVEEIKQQIEAGNYQIDVEKTAKAMADTLI